ncbi:MAG: RelA/SpoT domain-containing protein, partial [Acidobacteriota bacterium]|nr:RelA/SpoT domain-containing protein [Acidobacteriota bacterium]
MNRPSDFKEWHRRQIDDYSKNEYAIFSTYADVLHRVLQRVCSEHAKLGIVQSRPKAVSSFAEKVVRKWPAINDPIRQLTDLCGARVITHTQGEMEPICEFIETHFDIEEAEDVGSRLGATEFGYTSFHYIVRLRAEALAGVSLPGDAGTVAEILETIGSRKAEIQVRTLMQHAWADVMHDRLYKTRVKVPQAWQHLAARQAAILETADNEFSRIVEELDSYLVHYDAYMTPAEMSAE